MGFVIENIVLHDCGFALPHIGRIGYDEVPLTFIVDGMKDVCLFEVDMCLRITGSIALGYSQCLVADIPTCDICLWKGEGEREGYAPCSGANVQYLQVTISLLCRIHYMVNQFLSLGTWYEGTWGCMESMTTKVRISQYILNRLVAKQSGDNIFHQIEVVCR